MRMSMIGTTFVIGLITLGGCQPEKTEAVSQNPDTGLPGVVLRNRLHGVLLGQPQEKPDFILTTMDGGPFDFRRETEGKLTLLFFGYTHCPDICPVHMANIGRVIKGLPEADASRITVVFVTTDPERDTPERLRGWLANFHPDFIGLTGTLEAIQAAQVAARLMLATKEVVDSAAPGNYFVAHAGQVLAFTSDNLSHIIYPFGMRQDDWANDLPILVNGWPQ
jgi:protein SCO1/2